MSGPVKTFPLFGCLLAALAIAGLGACASEPEYDLKPAAEWTICPATDGYPPGAWESAADRDKWLRYMWDNNCTFPFIGWDADIMIELNQHPESLDD